MSEIPRWVRMQAMQVDNKRMDWQSVLFLIVCGPIGWALLLAAVLDGWHV